MPSSRVDSYFAVAGAVGLAMSLLVSVWSLHALDSRAATSPAAFDPALIRKGAELAALGNCVVCHTATDDKPYAGARPLPTPFGTIYSANITPDSATGIGQWSEAMFVRALREGIDPKGNHLYPAFPYDYFTRLTDDDLKALFAFVMTRDAVRQEVPPNKVVVPRFMVSAWKLLYFKPGAFTPDPSKSAEWNRGAYLVEGIAHCGACHSPRNVLGAEKQPQRFGGGEAEGWYAPALDASSPAPSRWTADRLVEYLRTGLDDSHDAAAGPMVSVVHSLERASDSDVRAIATYVASLGGDSAPRSPPAARESRAGSDGDHELEDGAAIYASTCASCHESGRHATSEAALDLGLSTAIFAPTPRNVIHTVREGIIPAAGERGRWMPSFAEILTDDQLVALVRYLRMHFTVAPAWDNVATEVKKAKGARSAS